MKTILIILTYLIFNTGLIVSAVVHSEEPIKADEQTGRYLENLGASQHGQTSVKYNFEQHGSQYSKDSMNQRNSPVGQYGSQYSKDSMNQRNSPRWNALVVDVRNPSRKRLYLQDSMNKRNNPGGKYYEPANVDYYSAGDVTEPQRTIVTMPLKQW